jgi:hypothetical protein
VQSGINPPDKRPALLVARSLQNLLFFYEVEWGSRALQDGVEDVYMFLDDYEIGASGSGSGGVGESTGSGDSRGANGTGGGGGIAESSPIERTELPTGIITYLTKCYSPLCDGYGDCYAYDCPRRVSNMWRILEWENANPLFNTLGINTASTCARAFPKSRKSGMVPESTSTSVVYFI